MIEGISQIGSFSTPYIVNGLEKAGQHPVAYLSIFVLIVGIFPLKFVRETMVNPKSIKEGSEEDEKK